MKEYIKPLEKYNELTFLKEVDYKITKSGKKIRFGIFQCSCGKNVEINMYAVKEGATRSCGHFCNGNPTHSMSKSRFYQIWASMKKRCTNPNYVFFKDYGGRGIVLCDRWMEFMNFKEDMYDDYCKHFESNNGDTCLDRKNNMGNYEKENCEWVTRKENNGKKRNSFYITYKGETKILKQWCIDLNLRYKAVHSIMKYQGLSFEDTLKKPKIYKLKITS